MPRVRASLLWLAALAACTPRPDLAITNVVVYRGDGSAPFPASVVIDDGLIVAIERDHVAKAKTVLDGGGGFLVPGLWDMHTHIRSSESDGLDVSKFLDYGVTSIRDLGAVAARLDEYLASAEPFASPAVYAARTTLNGASFGPHQQVVASEREARDAVVALAAAGADLIKIHRATRPELLPALLDAAHVSGLRLTGHIPLGLHPMEVCRLGMDGIEHVGSIAEALISVTPEYGEERGRALEYLLSADAEPLYRCLAERRVAVTPTLVIYPAIASRHAGSGEMPPEFRAFIDAMQGITYRLYAAGVPLLVGTDTTDLDTFDSAPGASFHDELAMLQDAGVPAASVLVMATGDAARWLGVDDVTGTIEVGRVADLLLVGADPGNDIRNLRAIRAVFRQGRQVTPR